jgi:rare lipoprotein A
MRTDNEGCGLHARSRAPGNILSLLAGRPSPVACCLVLLSACATRPPSPPPGPVPTANVPAEILTVPDPIPKIEPRSSRGNPRFYEVFGKRYFVMESAAGYVERGVASWYGPGFHKERTATGDPYDMYAMTAAHKTLPLPCYARVTNLSNGRSVIVRINDRGPFKDGRIIDLSYAAATKLDMVRSGTALVEVRAIGENDPGTPSATASLFVQAGAFTEAMNADRLITRLKSLGYASAFTRKESRDGRDILRVRIGPVTTVAEFDRIVAHLRSLGIDDVRLAEN